MRGRSSTPPRQSRPSHETPPLPARRRLAFERPTGRRGRRPVEREKMRSREGRRAWISLLPMETGSGTHEGANRRSFPFERVDGYSRRPSGPQSWGSFLSGWNVPGAGCARSESPQKPIARARITPTHRLVAATRSCWINLCCWCLDTVLVSRDPLRGHEDQRAVRRFKRQGFSVRNRSLRPRSVRKRTAAPRSRPLSERSQGESRGIRPDGGGRPRGARPPRAGADRVPPGSAPSGSGSSARPGTPR